MTRRKEYPEQRRARLARERPLRTRAAMVAADRRYGWHVLRKMLRLAVGSPTAGLTWADVLGAAYVPALVAVEET